MADAERRRERQRGYQRTYEERHPERKLESGRQSSARWRDSHPDEARARNRDSSALNREKDPERYRRWYQANLDRERDRARDSSRRRTRLKQLGLPPRRAPRSFAADRRVNAAAADAFFRRDWSSEADAIARAEAPQLLTRQRFLASSDPVPQELIDRFKATTNEIREGYEEFELQRRLPQIIEQRGRRHMSAVREEVRMDQVARKINGKPPLDVDREIEVRVAARVLEQSLTPSEQEIYDRMVAKRERAALATRDEIRARFKEAPAVQDLKRRLPAMIARNRYRHEAGVAEQVAKEAAARVRAGGTAGDVDAEVERRIAAEVIKHDLPPADRTTLAQLREALAEQAQGASGGAGDGGAVRGGQVWVREHTRNGVFVAGHWRDR